MVLGRSQRGMSHLGAIGTWEVSIIPGWAGMSKEEERKEEKPEVRGQEDGEDRNRTTEMEITWRVINRGVGGGGGERYRE